MLKDQAYYNRLFWEHKNRQLQIELYGKIIKSTAMTDVQKASINYLVGTVSDENEDQS